jgi:L-fuculose-phosphate aldolase
LQAAAAYGEVKPVNDVLAAESHDFLLKPSIVRASFAMFARRVERQMAAE